MPNKTYDTIIIGSGAGGLTAAVALAQAGQKVLVCEQHEVPGGWTQSFTLEGYRFSPGVHYIGGLEPGGGLRQIYRGLGISQDIEFCELNPDGFDHIFIGQEQFDIPKGKRKYINRLKDRFPEESEGIEAYFQAIEDIIWKLKTITRPRYLFKRFRALRWFFRSGGDLINNYVNHPVLRAILAGQSGDHGMPPNRVSAAVHAGVVHHYFKGGFYPRGGGFAIPRAFVRALKRAGGEIRLNTSVEQIIIQNKQAVGIQLPDGEKLFADNIISNADPHTTFTKLIQPQHIPRRLRRKLENVEYSTSSISLFLAVDMDLKAAGLDSGNYWFYDHPDLDEIYTQGLSDHILQGNPPPALFMTVTTLKDPSKMHHGHHTLEIFSFISYDGFEKWANDTTGDRAWEYEKLKTELTNQILTAVDKRVPGFKDAVVFKDLGTPLTNQYYINAHKGNLYGIAKSVRQVGPGAFQIKSPIKHLYLCGASTLSHGVSGATYTGLAAARQILNCKTRDLLKQKGPEIRIYPSDDLSKWPEHLQKRIQRGQQAAN